MTQKTTPLQDLIQVTTEEYHSLKSKVDPCCRYGDSKGEIKKAQTNRRKKAKVKEKLKEWEDLCKREIEACSAASEVRDAYMRTPPHENSPSREMALQRWSDLCPSFTEAKKMLRCTMERAEWPRHIWADVYAVREILLRESSTTKDCKALVELVGLDDLNKNKELKVALEEKWLELCKTEEEFREHHKTFEPYSDIGPAAEKADELLAPEIDKVSTPEELKRLWKRCVGWKSKSDITQKVLETATTLDDLWWVWRKSGDSVLSDHWHSAYTGYGIRIIERMVKVCKTVDEASRLPRTEESLRKWRELSRQEIATARSIDEVRKACERTPPQDSARDEALKKWSKLCRQATAEAKTLEEAQDIHNRSPKGEDAGLTRWREFSAKEVKEAKTAEEVSRALHRCPPDSPERSKAVKKLRQLLG